MAPCPTTIQNGASHNGIHEEDAPPKRLKPCEENGVLASTEGQEAWLTNLRREDRNAGYKGSEARRR